MNESLRLLSLLAFRQTRRNHTKSKIFLLTWGKRATARLVAHGRFDILHVITFFLVLFCWIFFQRQMASRGEALIAVKDFGEKGRGVVALKNFSRGDLIEEAHCIYFPKEEVDLTNKTILKEYTFVAGSSFFFLV